MDFKKKINFFEKNKFFCELIEKNNEGLEIIRGLIIFVLDILMNYNTNFFMFFFDIDADTKKYNLLIIFSFFILLSEILSKTKIYSELINLTKIIIYAIHLIILIIITVVLLKKNKMWGWSFYFFLMVFNFLMIIGIIKNIYVFYNNNNLEKSEKNNFNEIKEENTFNETKNENTFNEINENNFDKKNEINDENNYLINKYAILKKLTFIFDCKKLFFGKHRLIHAIHAITMLLMYVLLFFNTDLYDLFLSDVGGFSKFILILIIILICFVEICYMNEKAIFSLYFFYYIIFVVISLFSLPNKSTWSLPFHILLHLINTNIFINLKLNAFSKMEKTKLKINEKNKKLE